MQDRKQLLRLAVEDITLDRVEDGIVAWVRFRGGATETTPLPRPLNAAELRPTDQDVIERIDALSECRTESEIAVELNRLELKTGTGAAFTASHITWLGHQHRIRTRCDRLRSAGMRTAAEMAEEFDVTRETVAVWRRAGLLRAVQYNDKREYLDEPLAENHPRKQQGHKLSERNQSCVNPS